MFIDYAEIDIKGGDGGDGAIAFRREKYVPKGGPSGGNGGNGGNIIFRADRNLLTLLDFRYKRKYIAPNGENGGSSLKDGKNGKDIIVKIPVGTIVREPISERILFDFNKDDKSEILAKGGKGGRGNSKFATPTNQTPRNAEKGRKGEERNIILELKLIADVGLVGFPNAGKSTLISTISAARPKIADYPFTTLEPNLGIVKYKDYKSFTVADIPGIIEGAHKGKGLGLKFLQHIERTKIILLLIEITSEDIQNQFSILTAELEKYSHVLSAKKKIIAFTKSDLVEKSELEKIRKKKLKKFEGPMLAISSITGQGISELLETLWSELSN